MKRILTALLLMPVICLVTCCAAANGWGLRGPLLNYVEKNRDFDDYSAIAEYYSRDCPVSAAVMHSRYHNILLVDRKDENGTHSVWCSATAVWQPDERDETPAISCTDATVTLKPGKFDTYVFSWDRNENTFLLTRAEYGSFALTLRDGVYYTDSGIIWQAQPVDLQSFNISLFPGTEYELLRMNRIYAAVSDASGFWYEKVTCTAGKKLPVYSAPDSNSYRGAKGKAAVNTSENFRLLASLNDWDLVEYEVSVRTHRTGWINRADLSQSAPVMMTDVPVLSVQYMTDDPYWSQYRAFTASQLRNVHLLAQANPFYAYASAETADGSTVWGFVPVQGCALPDEKIDESAMAEFCGTWVFASGGEIAAEVMALHADGTCELGGLKNEAVPEQPDLIYGLQAKDYTLLSSGTWYVIDSLSQIGYGKSLVLKVNGRITDLGLYDLPRRNEDGYMAVTVCSGETGGGYVKVAEEDQPLQISVFELTYTDPASDTVAYGFDYAKLEERWKAFFPEDIWSKARFLTDPEWENNAAYNAEHHLGVFQRYPIVTVLDGNVQLHLFNVTEEGIGKIAETRIDCGMKETDGYKVSSPRYHLLDAVGEMDGIYRYDETLDLYFFRSTDPWNIQISLETTQADDPDIMHVTSVLYQYTEAQKTPILGQKQDYEIIHPTEEGLCYGYAYFDEPISDTVLLPLNGSTKLTEFSLSSFPADPDGLLKPAKTETGKHGAGGKVNLRQRPEKNGRIIEKVPNGASVRAADLGNGWCFVRYKDHCGYMMAEYIEGTEAWEKK